MNTLETSGGSRGGTEPHQLTRSDLQVMERACNEGRFPFDPETDREVLQAVAEIARNGKNARAKLAAAKVLVAMKRANIAIDELNAPPKQIRVGNMPGEVFKTYLGIDPGKEPGARQIPNGQ